MDKESSAGSGSSDLVKLLGGAQIEGSVFSNGTKVKPDPSLLRIITIWFAHAGVRLHDASAVLGSRYVLLHSTMSLQY
jgi:hypothetical protein